MTLPAGQISLSEVNVELGFSTTALISLNDTPVRNLAGVPSGQISMSNLQGKSAATYWLFSTSNTTMVGTKGMAVAENGTFCLCSNDQQLYFFDTNGAFLSAKNANSYYTVTSGSSQPIYVESYVNNDTISAPIFYGSQNTLYYSPYGFTPFNSTNNTVYFTSSRWAWINQGAANYQGSALQNLSRDSSGNIYIYPFQSIVNGKFPAYQIAISKVTSTGSWVWTYTSGITSGAYNNAPAEYTSAAKTVMRTDNVLVVVGVYNSTTIGIFTVNTSTAAVINRYLYSRTSGTDQHLSSPFIDSSNNIYIGLTNSATPRLPRIYKVDSSFSVVGAKVYNPTSAGTVQNSYAGCFYAFYNGVIYVMTSPSISVLTIFAVDASTLNPTWTLNITDGAGGTFTQGAQNYMRQLFATGAGIFAIFKLSSASSSTLVMKLPLDGNVSGTKVLATQGGINVTLTFSKVTSGSNMASGTNTTFAFTSNPSAFSYMQLTGGTTGGNGSAPTTAGTPSKTVTNL